jgi:Lon protease-like protein
MSLLQPPAPDAAALALVRRLLWAALAPLRYPDARAHCFEFPRGAAVLRGQANAGLVPAEVRLTLGVRDVLLLRNRDRAAARVRPGAGAAGPRSAAAVRAGRRLPYACDAAPGHAKVTVRVGRHPDPGWARLRWRLRALGRGLRTLPLAPTVRALLRRRAIVLRPARESVMMRAWPRSPFHCSRSARSCSRTACLPLQMFEVRYLDMISHCLTEDTPFGVVLLTQGQEVRTAAWRWSASSVRGTLATVQDTTATTPGLLQVVCRGGARFAVLDSERLNGLWMAEAELVEDDHAVRIPSDLKGAADALDRVLASLHDVPQSRWPVQPPFRLDDCGWVANRWCELLPLPNHQKQQHAHAGQPDDPAGAAA